MRWPGPVEAVDASSVRAALDAAAGAVAGVVAGVVAGGVERRLSTATGLPGVAAISVVATNIRTKKTDPARVCFCFWMGPDARRINITPNGNHRGAPARTAGFEPLLQMRLRRTTITIRPKPAMKLNTVAGSGTAPTLVNMELAIKA